MLSERDQLTDFIRQYFTAHDALARTAWKLPNKLDWRLVAHEDHKIISGLTGCSRELIDLIGQISDLAELLYDSSETEEARSGYKSQANDVETRLHSLEQLLPISPDDETMFSANRETPETILSIAEMKRLAALIYFYTRLRCATPDEPHIVRLTLRILSTLPKIPLKANALLWPLFVIGTMGIQRHNDEDRMLVLDRLDALQRIRQLGNVKKVRQVVEDVWKYRDLNADACSHPVWSEVVARSGARISLA
jgi:hypothetical protein